ncbi:hypothetical protein [Prescottella agglutinans]|uniref:Secreted protein n=1 Tax=Prescottella agglutinans TaxID=1644129 RepID=A0ABT6MHJ5_9NOCA|nr:hypothetical protein [Prescottella agglutinans]MDH6283801.1 hypothetical protein [Prescottella agglutinans]
MLKRIVGIAASVGILVGIVSQTPAAAQPIDDMAAVQSALHGGMPVGARTAQSIVTTLGRIAASEPRYNFFPRSAHLVEGVVQPFLYDTAAAECLSPGFGDRNYSVGVAQAIAGPAVDTSLPVPVIPPGTVNILFNAMNTAKSDPFQSDPLTVSWLNLDTMRSGVAPLYQERPADHPRTLSNTIETGRGTVVFVVSGSVLDNTSRNLPPCDYAPVVGVVHA